VRVRVCVREQETERARAREKRGREREPENACECECECECVCVCVCVCDTYSYIHVGWLQIVGSFKILVSFAAYRLFYRALLPKKPMFFGSLIIVASSYIPIWGGYD